MDDDATVLVPFYGGAPERAAWDRLRAAAEEAGARRAVGAQRERYRRRCEQELAALARLGIEPAVLLELSAIVHDLAARGVAFGPGYGPQCGSWLLCALGLTGVDPLEHGLPFLGLGRELETRRLHLQVASRSEQAELAAAIRRHGGRHTGAVAAQPELEVVIGRDPALGLTREMARMARDLDGGREWGPGRGACPWEDAQALRLMARGETEGVSVLDAGEVPAHLRRAAPRSLEEVVQVVAAAREGAPQGFLERYIRARTGAERPEPPHPDLEPIVEPTAGIWLYREQIVEAVARLAGCGQEAAERAVQQLAEESAHAHEGQHSRELAGRIARTCAVPEARGLYLVRALRRALARAVDRAALLPGVIEAYRQAYYKAHYPAAFQAARLNAALARIAPEEGARYVGGSQGGVAPSPAREALVAVCREAVRGGITVLPPSVNRSLWRFRAQDRWTLRFGLGAIATIDRTTAERIVNYRRCGTYRSVADLLERGLGGIPDARRLEALVFAGALDDLGGDRWRIWQQLQRVLDPDLMRQKTAELGVTPVDTGVERLWQGGIPGPGWCFQRELDVLACVPSRQYFPEPAPADWTLRPVR